MSAPAVGDIDIGDRGPRKFASLDAHGVALVATVFVALGAAYVAMCVKAAATGFAGFLYGDFHALWVSGVLAHDGASLVNFDSVALHAKQIALGVDPHRDNPFPYPPTFLLLLAPLGALPLGVAFWLFMGGSLAAFVASLVAGRVRDVRWWVAGLAAPATGIALISGQSGLLSGALMIGGFRLAAARPIAAGVLFGLLTFKPQLGVLIPVALIAAGLWRAAAAATLTALGCVVASGLAFGFAVWPAWAQEMRSYAGGYDLVVNLMPTIDANFRNTVLGTSGALALQAFAALAVVVVVWRAFRSGVSEQGLALVTIGTFLATPHAFNYDMPMTSAAIAAYLIARVRPGERMPIYEVVIVAAAFLIPFVILAAHGALAPWTFAPGAALFALMARSEVWQTARQS
jgi:hypothetical protein